LGLAVFTVAMHLGKYVTAPVAMFVFELVLLAISVAALKQQQRTAP
jgi:hypothetical protein